VTRPLEDRKRLTTRPRLESFDDRTAVDPCIHDYEFLSTEGTTAVLIRILSIADSTLDHLFQHACTTVRLETENFESFVRKFPTN